MKNIVTGGDDKNLPDTSNAQAASYSPSSTPLPNRNLVLEETDPAGTAKRLEVVGLPPYLKKQAQGTNDCWAAVATTIHNFNAKSEKFTIEKTKARLGKMRAAKSEAANLIEIYGALAPEEYDALRDRIPMFILEVAMNPARSEQMKDIWPLLAVGAGLSAVEVSSTDIAASLKSGQPVVVGYKPGGPDQPGHICLIHAAEVVVKYRDATPFDVNATGRAVPMGTQVADYDLVSIDYLDPDPAVSTALRYDIASFQQRKDFVITQKQAKEFFAKLSAVMGSGGGIPFFR